MLALGVRVVDLGPVGRRPSELKRLHQRCELSSRVGILAQIKYPCLWFCNHAVSLQAAHALLAPCGHRHTLAHLLLLANTKFNNNTSPCVCSHQTWRLCSAGAAKQRLLTSLPCDVNELARFHFGLILFPLTVTWKDLAHNSSTVSRGLRRCCCVLARLAGQLSSCHNQLQFPRPIRLGHREPIKENVA